MTDYFSYMLVYLSHVKDVLENMTKIPPNMTNKLLPLKAMSELVYDMIISQIKYIPWNLEINYVKAYLSHLNDTSALKKNPPKIRMSGVKCNDRVILVHASNMRLLVSKKFGKKWLDYKRSWSHDNNICKNSDFRVANSPKECLDV